MTCSPSTPSRASVITPVLLLFLVGNCIAGSAQTATKYNTHHIRGTDRDNNMNGDYVLASTPLANNTKGLFPTHYRDYPDITTESFDVYSPIISTLYSQVFWKGLPPVSLPQHIVDKYNHKGMAVVGFEIDQVMMITSDHKHNNGETQREISVPMNAVYNHHFESTMIGGQETRFELASPDDPRVAATHNTISPTNRSNGGHGIPPHQPYWLVVGGNAASATGLPTRQDFGGANGGEARKSFHGYAPGFVQSIESPREIQITPMQIDTWHRTSMPLNNNNNNMAPFVAGPLPRNSKAPPNATYSGLLECPVTTRITKHLPPQGVFPLATGQCSSKNNNININNGTGMITNIEDCYNAVISMVRESDVSSQIHQVSPSFHHPRRPAGCSMRALTIPVNTKTMIQRNGVYLTRLVEAFFNPLINTSGTSDESQTRSSTTKNEPCGASQTTNIFSATATSLVNISVVIDHTENTVTLQLTGPADVWFGVGFGAQTMSNQPWTIVVSGGENSTVTEHKLEDHSPGTIVAPSIRVISNTINVDGAWRTVTLTRSIEGRYFSFRTLNTTEIRFINAVGSSEEFAYHENKEASSMLLLPVAAMDSDGSSICVCQEDPPPFGFAKGGVLEYHPVQSQVGERGVTGKVALHNHCPPRPRGDLLEQQNPTCDIRTYTNGQTACHHMWSLLDADQDIPWPDQPIEYRLKFRFWVQPYNSTYHTNVHRTVWGIASPTEYDVPKCSEGIPGCSFQRLESEHIGLTDSVYEGKWVHTIRGSFSAGNVGKLVSAHFHCHAPTCLRTALYLCDEGTGDQGCDETTGRLLCEENAVKAEGNKWERFEEPGFIYQPPCLWGSARVGLEPPVHVTGRTLFAIKTADATYGHGGEMAWLQIYYV